MTSIRRFRIFCMLVIACALCSGILSPPLVRADTSEADQITHAQQLITDKKYDDALAILTPLVSSPEPTAHDAKSALERCYRSAKQWDKAISILQSCIQAYPADTASWQARLGRCYKEMGDNTKAIAAFKNGLDFTPRTPNMTQTLTEFLWQCYAEKNNWDAAISYYQSLLVKYPEDAAEWHYQLGRCCISAGKSAEAIAEYEKAMELVKDPDTAKRMEPALSNAYQGMGDFGKAEALLTKLNQKYPSYSSYWASCHALVLIRQGWKLQREGEYDKAIPLFQDMLDRFGHIPECRNLVESAHVCIAECMCQMGKGKPDEALAYAKKLYDEKPDMRAPALVAKGMVSFFAKNYDDAADAFRQVVNDYPDNMHTQMARSYLLAALKKAGRIDEAVGLLRASLVAESDPDKKAATLLQIADAYYKAKRYSDAIKAFKEVMDLKGVSAEMNAEATYNSGLCYYEIKSYSSARKCMDNVIKLYPDSEWAKEAINMLYIWDDLQTE